MSISGSALITLCFLLISSACESQVKEHKIDQEKIVGTWMQKENRNGYSVFTQTEEFDYDHNKLMSTGKYDIKGDVLTTIDKKNGQAYTYKIVKLSVDSLVLQTIIRGMEPYTIHYYRKKP